MQTTNLAPITVHDLPDVNWPRHEIIDGSLYVTPMPNVRHQLLVDVIRDAVRPSLPADLVAMTGPGIFRQADGLQRLLVPDLAVVDASAARRIKLAFEPADVVLVVEVLSRSTKHVDRGLKSDLYRELGIGACWICDPEQGTLVQPWAWYAAPTWVGDAFFAAQTAISDIHG